MDIATKNVFKFVIPWIAGMLLLLIIQVVGDFFLVNEIVEQPYYYCAIIWCMFAVLSAKFEAYYYSLKQVSKLVIRMIDLNINEHILFTIIRAVVIIPIWILTDWKAIICYMCMFPFIHDGSYYAQRERIKPGTYPKKWMAQSVTSTAWSTKFFTPVVRIILFSLAVFALIVLRYKYL